MQAITDKKAIINSVPYVTQSKILLKQALSFQRVLLNLLKHLRKYLSIQIFIDFASSAAAWSSMAAGICFQFSTNRKSKMAGAKKIGRKHLPKWNPNFRRPIVKLQQSPLCYQINHQDRQSIISFLKRSFLYICREVYFIFSWPLSALYSLIGTDETRQVFCVSESKWRERGSKFECVRERRCRGEKRENEKKDIDARKGSHLHKCGWSAQNRDRLKTSHALFSMASMHRCCLSL